MILVHDNLHPDAVHLQRVIEEVYGIPVELRDRSVSDLFTQIPEFNGYLDEPRRDILAREFPNMAILLLVPLHLYGQAKSREDDWVFGASYGLLSVIATPLLKVGDRDLYLRRLSYMGIHELGHDLIRAPHHIEAIWVNAKTGYCMPLGAHCDDNSCVMFEIADTKTPSKDEGHLLFGGSPRYDAGLDDCLRILRPDWFCPRCREHLVIPKAYFA
jgi:hypothetical protein